MKAKLSRFLNASRYSTVCTKCGFRYRQYCSKSNDKFSKPLNENQYSKSTQYTADVVKDLLEFEYPEQKIHESDYMKPRSYYIKENFINTFKFPKSTKITDQQNFCNNVEFLIIGAGPIGTATAFWLKKVLPNTIPVLVIDKNLAINEPSDNSEAYKLSLQSSLCTLRQEFELKENVELSLFGAEFLRKMDRFAHNHLDFSDVPFQPFGFLTLSDKKSSEKLKKIHFDSALFKARNELLTPYQLEQRYPWLNTENVELALHGLKNEGWFDPDVFLMKMRAMAVSVGAKFIEAEVLEFTYEENEGRFLPGFKAGEYRPSHSVFIKTSKGDIRKVDFATCIVALGHEVGTFSKEMLYLDKKYNGMHHLEIPIIPRKRYLYCVSCDQNGPGISSPLIVDSCGLFVRRYGPLNEYICGCPPLMNDESTLNMNEYEYFENVVWPLLEARIPAFKNLRVLSSITYFEDYNTFDGLPIVGFHPAFHNFIFVTGFGDRSYSHAAGVGRCIADIYFAGRMYNIDLTRFSFNRIVQESKLFDSYVI